MAPTVAHLLETLRQRRIAEPGPREWTRVEALLRSRQDWETESLALALAALLSSSEAQWAAVHATAREVLEGLRPERGEAPAERPLPLAMPASAPPSTAMPARPADARRAAWAWLAFVLALCAAVALGLARREDPRPPPRVAASTALPTPAGPAAPGQIQAILQVEREAGVLSTTVPGAWTRSSRLWLGALALVGLLLAWAALPAWSAPGAITRARAAAEARRRQRRAEDANAGGRQASVYRVEAFPVLPRAAMDDAGALIARRRRSGWSEALDVPATLDATLRAGGRARLIYEAGRRSPEILVLLDVEGGAHPFLEGAEQVLARWRQLGVRMEIRRYGWRFTPNELRALSRRTEGSPLLLLSRLAAVGDTHRGGRAWLRALRQWERAAVLDLDPRPAGDRGDPSQDALHMLADLGLPRFPFTDHGLLAAAAWLGGGERRPAAEPSALPEPLAPATQAALRWWATAAAYVPDPSWAQLEAIRRRFPEVHGVLGTRGAVHLLVEWIRREARAHGQEGDPLRGDGDRLAVPPELNVVLQAACIAADRGLPFEARFETRARRLLIEQLRGALPDGPMAEAERRMKLVLHEAVLDPDQADLILAELQGSALAPDMAEALNVQRRLVRPGGGFTEAVWRQVDRALARGPARAVPARELRRHGRSWGGVVLAVAVLAVGWGSFGVWRWSRPPQVQVPGDVALPAEYRVELLIAALADTPQPMRFLRLGGGTFQMGSPVGEEGRDDDETQHEVRVAAFEMGVTEVTQGQWEAVMGSNPSNCSFGCGADLPVQNVSWLVAVEFLNRLSAREGLVPCYAISGEDVRWDRACTGYRLPTEAEWEYAARAGTETAWSWGAEASAAGQYAWYGGNAGGNVHPVGTKQANPWGLHDMHGNVWEWAWDWYGPYDVDNVVDNGGAAEGENRVVRGGSFVNDPVLLRSAGRNWLGPSVSDWDRGFRCARSAPQR